MPRLVQILATEFPGHLLALDSDGNVWASYRSPSLDLPEALNWHKVSLTFSDRRLV